MSLSLGLSGWILAALLVGAGLGGYWLYRGTVPRLNVSGRTILGLLRFLSLGLIAFLLVEPLLTRSDVSSEPPVVAVLVDNSQSMAGEGDDTGDSRTTGIRQASGTLIASLTGADVRTFAFGGSLEESLLDSMAFDKGRTDVARSLDRALAELEGANLAAVVLISDGQYNTGRNPIHTAERFPVPIYTVAVGDTASQRDVQVRRVLTNDIAYRNVALPLDVGISHAGFGGTRVTVRIAQGGRVLDQQQVDLPVVDGESTIRLEVVPDTTGLMRYDISVSRSEGEYTFRNNTLSATVRVLESRRRVLVLAGAPSPDLTALRAVLTADDESEVDLFVRRASGGYFQGSFPDPSPYDLIILAGFPSVGTDVAEIDRVSALALEGKPVLFLLDYATDLRLMQRLGAALPTVPRTVRSGRSEGTAVLTIPGARHPVVALPEDLPADVWSAMPPLTVTDATWQTSPDAVVLATTAIRGIALDDPLMAVRRRSGSRSAALLAYGTWRWSNLPQNLARLDPVWPTLVQNLTQWLVAPEDDRPVRVRPATSSFGGGEEVEFSGQVYDESAAPVSGADVSIQVTTPEGATLPFSMRSVGNGRYRARLGTLPEGTYAWEATGSLDSVELGRDRGTFAVGPLALEFRDTRTDMALLRQIALRSGGALFLADDAGGVASALSSSPGFAPRVRTVEASVRLWQRYPFLLAVLLLLTAEWFLRKRRGLV